MGDMLLSSMVVVKVYRVHFTGENDGAHAWIYQKKLLITEILFQAPSKKAYNSDALIGDEQTQNFEHTVFP